MTQNCLKKVIAVTHLNPFEISDSDRKAFLTAARKGDFKTIEQLYQTNPKIIDSQTTTRHWNGLHYAAITGNVLLTRFLVSKGLDPLTKTIDGQTAIQLAKESHHGDIARFLTKKVQEQTTLKQQLHWDTFGVSIQAIKELAEKESRKPPVVYIMYAWGNPDHEEWVTRFAGHLFDGGITMRFDRWNNMMTGTVSNFTEKIGEVDSVIVIGTPLMRDKITNRYEHHILQIEADLLDGRIKYQKPFRKKVFPILLDGTREESFHDGLSSPDDVYTDVTDGNDGTYFIRFAELMGKLYEFEHDHKEFGEIIRQLKQDFGKVTTLPNYRLDEYKKEREKRNQEFRLREQKELRGFLSNVSSGESVVAQSHLGPAIAARGNVFVGHIGDIYTAKTEIHPGQVKLDLFDLYHSVYTLTIYFRLAKLADIKFVDSKINVNEQFDQINNLMRKVGVECKLTLKNILEDDPAVDDTSRSKEELNLIFKVLNPINIKYMTFLNFVFLVEASFALIINEILYNIKPNESLRVSIVKNKEAINEELQKYISNEEFIIQWIENCTLSKFYLNRIMYVDKLLSCFKIPQEK